MIALIVGLFSNAALASTIILPPGNDLPQEEVPNAFPIGAVQPGRYQQVYSSEDFPAGPISVSSLSFRIDWVSQSGMPSDFSAIIQSIDILLSTTARDPDGLSAVFSDNVGEDLTLVFTGLLDLGSVDPGEPEDPAQFHVTIHFQREFSYDPQNGNLLFEARNHTGTNLPNGNAIFYAAATSAGDGTSRVYEFFDPLGAAVQIGRLDSFGLVTSFAFTSVPEPGSFLLLGGGVAGLWAVRRLTRRCS
jgi:hypothetical protein